MTGPYVITTHRRSGRKHSFHSTVFLEERTFEASDQDSEKGETGDEAKTDNNEAPAPEEKEILPPLFARTDPDTLLARLNTRRLFQRVLHFKRRQRKKLDADTINLLLENNNGDAEGKVESIREMYENELKEKMTANRVWRKDMTIQEMADLEWDEVSVDVVFMPFLH